MQPTTAPTVEEGGALRSDAVSARHLVFFVVSAAAPLTVMAGFAPLAFLLGGQTAPVGYLAAGAAYALFAVGFCAMARHVRNAGAFYAYITRGLGRVIGSGSALVAYVAYTLGEIGFCAAAGLFASNALGDLAGIHLSWGVCAVILGVLVSVVAYCRVDVGARVLALLLAGELGLLLALAIAVFAKGTPEGLSLKGFDPSVWSVNALGSLFVITFVVYIGFEQTAVYSEEARDPRRTVPRATYISVGLLALTYTFISWALLMAIGPAALGAALADDPAQLVFAVNQTYLGTFMTDVMQVLIVTSFVAGVLALHNAGSRYLFALGRDRLLPRSFGTTGGNGAPSRAVVVQSVLVVVALAGFGLSSLDPYTQVVIWTNTPTLVGVLCLQILTSIAVVVFFARTRTDEGLWQRLIAPSLATVVLGVVLYLVFDKMGLLTGLGAGENLLINVPLLLAFVGGAVRGAVAAR